MLKETQVRRAPAEALSPGLTLYLMWVWWTLLTLNLPNNRCGEHRITENPLNLEEVMKMIPQLTTIAVAFETNDPAADGKAPHVKPVNKFFKYYIWDPARIEINAFGSSDVVTGACFSPTINYHFLFQLRSFRPSMFGSLHSGRSRYRP